MARKRLVANLSFTVTEPDGQERQEDETLRKFPTQPEAEAYAETHGGAVVRHGAQKDFIETDYRYSAYIGGVGSGKTFAGVLRGILMNQQPKPPEMLYGPRGMICTATYAKMRDVVLPRFFEMVNGTGLMDVERDFSKSENKAIFRKNNAEILFRSLDNPGSIMGVELSWFFIDEGKDVTRLSWDNLVSRLRQPGYEHKGWVCSTPEGFDWMWELFHDESTNKLPNCRWFNAPTQENAEHLDQDYLDDLEVSFSGDWYRQMVRGEFVGLLRGAVFPHWDQNKHAVAVEYDPNLPLYSFWDFGIGDPGVCEFAQIDHAPVELPDGRTQYVKTLRFLDLVEAKEWTAADWARNFHRWCDLNVEGRRPELNIGDPTGRHRTPGSGTSMMDDLAACGVTVIAAPKKPIDYGVRILDNMMAGDRVLVDKDKCARLSNAFTTHRWKLDESGTKVGEKPIHNWTSHLCDPARYGASQLLSFYPALSEKPKPQGFNPAQLGYLLDQYDAKPEHWIGEGEQHIDFIPVALGPKN